jgi:hypothetical protein
MLMHRPLPGGADITDVQVTCRREGHHFTASASFTLLLPAAPAPGGGRVAAVHAGWRAMPDGSLRVAVIRGAGTPPPGLLADLTWLVKGRKAAGATRGPARARVPALIDHGAWQEVVIPAEARDLAAHARSLRGIRARHLEEARKAVAGQLAAHPEHKEIIDPDGTADRWRSPRRFLRVLGALREADVPVRESAAGLMAALRAYEQQDMHLEDWEIAEERRLRNWRGDMYRKVAAWVTGEAAVVVTDQWEMRRRVPDAGEEESVREEAARANAARASPGELRQAVKVAAGRRGVAVRDAPEGMSGVHYGCGGELPAEERMREVMAVCRKCGRTVDQDVNAAAGMLASDDAVR